MGDAAETLERLDGLHLGTGWFLTWIDGVETVYMDERMTEASFDQYLVVIEELMRTASMPRPVLYEVTAPSVMNASARRRLSNLLNKYRTNIGKNTIAYALVTPSTAVRGVLTALFWVSPPPYPYKVCATTREAFEWLAGRTPELDSMGTDSRYATRRAQLMSRLS